MTQIGEDNFKQVLLNGVREMESHRENAIVSNFIPYRSQKERSDEVPSIVVLLALICGLVFQFKGKDKDKEHNKQNSVLRLLQFIISHWTFFLFVCIVIIIYLWPEQFFDFVFKFIFRFQEAKLP